MEHALRAATRAGVDEADFWRLTPYRLSVVLQERGRRQVEQALFTGWFAERFAREKELRGPQHYVAEFLDSQPNPELSEAMAEAELTRMAAGWGLEVEDIPSDLPLPDVS